MSDVTVSIDLDAAPADVWAFVEPIERHVDWMADAESISFDSDRTRGVGTRFTCVTKIGPITLHDRMEITEWQPVDDASAVGRMGVRHDGIVTGTGVFTIEPLPGALRRCRFTWSEDLDFPWYFAGRLGAAVAGRIVLGPLWRRNLRALQRLVESGQPSD
jgi:hypothetical protein